MTGLLILIGILSISTAISPFLAYRKGLRDAQYLYKGQEIKPFNVPKIKPNAKTPKDEKTQKTLDYINNFKA